jgi:arginine decarboxylase
MWTMPKRMLVVSGTGNAFTSLNAFDTALLDAGIANFNHVKLSSIIPPEIELISQNNLVLSTVLPAEGSLLPGVLAECRGKKGELLIAALALAFNKDNTKPGMIFELTIKNSDIGNSRLLVSLMVKKAMEKRHWEIKSVTVKSAHITVVDNYGCAVVAAIMLP